MTELQLIDRIRRMARNPGIGDDCFIFRPRANQDLLFTTDQMIEDIHFLKAHNAQSVGERALARGLSDIAAMGGTPRLCLVSLAIPAGHEKWMEEFYRRS